MLALAGMAALCFALAAAVVLHPNARFFIYNIPIGFVFVLAALEWVRLAAAALAQVTVLKRVFWQDATWFGGMLIGAGALVACCIVQSRDYPHSPKNVCIQSHMTSVWSSSL